MNVDIQSATMDEHTKAGDYEPFGVMMSGIILELSTTNMKTLGPVHNATTSYREKMYILKIELFSFYKFL